MFKICAASKTILRVVKPITVCSQARGLMEKKPANWLDKFRHTPTIEQVQNLKLIPKDFKVIYINDINPFLCLGIYLFYFCGAGAIYNFVSYCRDPDYLKREGRWGRINPWIGFLLAIKTVGLYFVVTRNIKYIFRRGNDLKYVFYAVFRFGGKKIVDGKVNEFQQPKSQKDIFHYLDDKRVVIVPQYFLSYNEYLLILK